MNYRGISIAGVLQVILAFALSTGILLLFFGAVNVETASLANLNPLFAEHRSPAMSILAILAISPFLFVGFDTVPQAVSYTHLYVWEPRAGLFPFVGQGSGGC